MSAHVKMPIEAMATTIHNGGCAEWNALPVHAIAHFQQAVLAHIANGGRVAAYHTAPSTPDDLTAPVCLLAILADDARGKLYALRTEALVSSVPIPALTAQAPQLDRFERDIIETSDLQLTGHPHPAPLRYPSNKGQRAGEMSGTPIQGPEVHQVAVGPVHAGVIEPGHFRFYCEGEKVHTLAIALGYQHRGIEKALCTLPPYRCLATMETMAGDTTIAHTWAYIKNLEALSGKTPSKRTQIGRAILLELERLANHTGDLGALASDIGLLPYAAHLGRLRGELLNLTAAITGSRFGRAHLCPGKDRNELTPELTSQLLTRLQTIQRELHPILEELFDAPSVLARFETTGALSSAMATGLGLVGVSARSCGIIQDIRHDYPWDIYAQDTPPMAAHPTGDVFARAIVRKREVLTSLKFIQHQLQHLPGDDEEMSHAPPPPPAPLGAPRIALTLIEGWRGECCHIMVTTTEGGCAAYKVVDPSFHNWPALEYAMRGQEISDFPLINKSFNLSYCGHDL